MAGVVLATGIVEVIPSLRGSQKRIASDLGAIDTAPVGAQLGSKMGGGIAGSLKRVVGGALVALGGMKLGALTKDAVGSFSELEDSTAAAGVVFGDSMGSIIKQSKGASKELGLSSQQVISAANTYGTYGKAAGLAGDDLATFSTDFTGLAADLASFKGTSPEQAIDAIGAALRGETEPLRTYGVMLDDASMRQKALELGIVDTTKNALTPQQKILAAQALIFEQTTDAQGDYARTSQSTANIAKTLAAETENLAAKFGQVLAPAFTASRKRAIVLVAGVSSLLDNVLAFQGALGEGANTRELTTALGLDPEQGFGVVVNDAMRSYNAFTNSWKANDGEITSSGVPAFFERAGYEGRQFADSLGNLWNVIARGDFTGPIFGQQEDSSFADTLFDIREGVQGLLGGDFEQLGPVFDSLLAVAKPAGPIFIEVGKGIGGLSTEIGQLVAGALPLAIPLLEGAANIMQYLADHTGVLTAVIVTAAAGWIAFKSAQALANVAQLLAVPVALANATANLSLAAAIRANTAASGPQLIAQKQSSVAMVKTGIAATGAAVGHGALATATGISTGATKLFGFAVKALPFMWIVTAIGAVVAGLVWFFTQTELGRGIVTAAWEGIQSAVGSVISWFETSVVPTAKTIFGAIGEGASWLYTNAVQPAFSGVKTAAGWVVGAFQNALAVAAPVFKGIGVVLNGFWLLARGIFQVVVSVIKNILIPAFTHFWTGVISPVFSMIGAKISSWWNFAAAIFGVAVSFIKGTLAGGFTWLRDSVISPVFSWIGNRISDFWTGAQIIFGFATSYLRNTFGPAFTWFRDSIIKPVWDFVGDKITDVYDDKIKPIFDFFGDKISKILPAAFETGKEAIEKTWNKIEGIAKAPVDFVVNTVLNGGLIKGFNTIADILPDVDRLPDIKLPSGWARGGILPGYNSAKSDDVLTPMRSGEGVLVPEAVRALGPSTIHELNHAGNTGGVSAVRTMLAGQEPQAAPGASVYGGVPSFRFPELGRIDQANAVRVLGDGPSLSRWYLNQAAEMWNGLANLDVITNGPKSSYTTPGIFATEGPSQYGNILNGGWAGYYQNSGIRFNPEAAWMSPTQRRTVAVHEIGHALGLPHAMATGAYSVMNYDTMYQANAPTMADANALRAIYGPPGSDNKRGTSMPLPEGDDGGDWDPLGFMLDGLTALLDTLIGKLKESVGGGLFTDVAIGVGRKIWGEAVEWLKDLLPGGDSGASAVSTYGTPAGVATVYDGGGWLHNTGGAQLVQHNKRKPDAVLSNEQWSDMSKLAAERSAVGDGDKVEMNVYPRENQSEETIAEISARKILRRRRR